MRIQMAELKIQVAANTQAVAELRAMKGLK